MNALQQFASKLLNSKKGLEGWESFAFNTLGHDRSSLLDIEEGDDEDKALKRYFKTRKEEVLDLFAGAEFVGQKLKVYRCLSVDGIDEVDLKDLGQSWTWSKSDVGCWGADNDPTRWYVIVGAVSLKDIELDESIYMNMTLSSEDEREMKLKSNAAVDVFEIYKYKGKERKVFKQPLRTHAAFRGSVNRLYEIHEG